jgi:hypothetical protein
MIPPKPEFPLVTFPGLTQCTPAGIQVQESLNGDTSEPYLAGLQTATPDQ